MSKMIITLKLNLQTKWLPLEVKACLTTNDINICTFCVLMFSMSTNMTNAYKFAIQYNIMIYG